MGRPTGFEPATPRITILCSNQLSYGRRKGKEENVRAPPPCQPFFLRKPSGDRGLDSLPALPKLPPTSMFFLKKILGHLLMPLPLGLGLVTVGILLLATRRRVPGWLALVVGWLVLLTAANRGVATALTASLETTYPPVPALAGYAAPTGELGAAPFVAVLGGGHGDSPDLSASQRLSGSARARLIEGVRLARALPAAWLVVSGPRNSADAPTLPTHARVLADAAVELGFPRERIVEIDTARDTAEETRALTLLAGSEPVALVTSAWHLPRAMKLATVAQLNALPCPADYLGGRDAATPSSAWLSWDAESLSNTTRAWREYLGQAWATLLKPRPRVSP